MLWWDCIAVLVSTYSFSICLIKVPHHVCVHTRGRAGYYICSDRRVLSVLAPCWRLLLWFCYRCCSSAHVCVPCMLVFLGCLSWEKLPVVVTVDVHTWIGIWEMPRRERVCLCVAVVFRFGVSLTEKHAEGESCFVTWCMGFFSWENNNYGWCVLPHHLTRNMDKVWWDLVLCKSPNPSVTWLFSSQMLL